uniref:DUF834 domain-containing protein n=2 Tax=Oryza TaxID=4527 RepID=A0A0D3HPW9_9ORYZ|nr:hypothetical protein [Oryza glaberrima]BBF89524.1 hypothetical protein [Oryza glaberrima]
MAAHFWWLFGWWAEVGLGGSKENIPLRCRPKGSGQIARMQPPERWASGASDQGGRVTPLQVRAMATSGSSAAAGASGGGGGGARCELGRGAR